MRLSKPADRRDPAKTLRVWLKELGDDVDGARTLQYELIDSLLSLRLQASKDGWMNWGGQYAERVDLLLTFLPSGKPQEQIRRDLEAVRETGADEGRFAYKELDRLVENMVHWCAEHRDWIQFPLGYTFWSNVPAESVPTTHKSWIQRLFRR